MQFTETIICCIPIHPFLKQGASLGVCDRWNGKCYAQFDGKAGRVKQVGMAFIVVQNSEKVRFRTYALK